VALRLCDVRRLRPLRVGRYAVTRRHAAILAIPTRRSPMADQTKITNESLIASTKVNGTTVYNRAGDKLGSVEDVMIDKVSGRAVYAIMSFGGFLGMGDKHHPLPWSVLDYDKKLEGYVVDLNKDLLEKAPSYDDEIVWSAEYGKKVDQYYKVPTYWI